MINNELHAHVRKEVTNQFAPRKSELKQPIDPARKKFFLGIMCQPTNKQPLSDYECTITKSYEKKNPSVQGEATADFVLLQISQMLSSRG